MTGLAFTGIAVAPMQGRYVAPERAYIDNQHSLTMAAIDAKRVESKQAARFGNASRALFDVCAVNAVGVVLARTGRESGGSPKCAACVWCDACSGTVEAKSTKSLRTAMNEVMGCVIPDGPSE